ncbi:MAG: LuxR C-terminal-related transcriptional regulator [Nitrospirales bacterium]|nr:LuxR C-terminal-related transcriptional regulator [Nitrospirales bacterium]
MPLPFRSWFLTHLIAGSTNSDIARKCRTSEHTVANQVQAISPKLGVMSCRMLALRL